MYASDSRSSRLPSSRPTPLKHLSVSKMLCVWASDKRGGWPHKFVDTSLMLGGTKQYGFDVGSNVRIMRVDWLFQCQSDFLCLQFANVDQTSSLSCVYRFPPWMPFQHESMHNAFHTFCGTWRPYTQQCLPPWQHHRKANQPASPLWFTLKDQGR